MLNAQSSFTHYRSQQYWLAEGLLNYCFTKFICIPIICFKPCSHTFAGLRYLPMNKDTIRLHKNLCSAHLDGQILSKNVAARLCLKYCKNSCHTPVSTSFFLKNCWSDGKWKGSQKWGNSYIVKTCRFFSISCQTDSVLMIFRFSWHDTGPEWRILPAAKTVLELLDYNS